MNNPTSQVKPAAAAADISTSSRPDLFQKYPFLSKKMTPEEFKEYVLMNNDEIPIDEVDFNPPHITA